MEEIERSGDLKDGYELDFARIDGTLDEVLEERRMGYIGEKEIPDSLKASGMKNGDVLSSNVSLQNEKDKKGSFFNQKGLSQSLKNRNAKSFLQSMKRGMKDRDEWTLEKFKQIPSSFWGK